MTTIIPITVWKRWDPEKEMWVHNHIDTGTVHGDKPTPRSKEQEVWEKQKWKKETALLINSKVTPRIETKTIFI